MRAQQTFDREISGSYDVSATIAAGVKLFEPAGNHSVTNSPSLRSSLPAKP